MKIFLLAFWITGLGSFSAYGQDTLTVSRDSLTAQNKKISNGKLLLKLALQKPVVVLLDGDCDPGPRAYTLYRKTPVGWIVSYQRSGDIVFFCGASQTSGLRIFLSFHLQKEGVYKIVLPIGDQKYFSGEIELKHKK